MSFWTGLKGSTRRPKECGRITHEALRIGDVLQFIWYRGVCSPVYDAYNTFMWWRGWGANRWTVRRGQFVRVHGEEPEPVLRVEFRRGYVTTPSGRHNMAHCCTPVLLWIYTKG